MKDNFDKCMKNSLNKKLDGIDCSEDIFNKAWDENISLKEREKYIMKKDIKKYVTAAALSIVILGSIIALSPSARAAVKTFFGLDSSGKIVEKSVEDTTTLGSVMKFTEQNKKTIEELLEFEIKQPDKIGIYTKATDASIPKIFINNVKFKDENKVYDEIKNSTDYKATVEKLKNNYDVKISLLTMYFIPKGDNNFNVFTVSQSKNPFNSSIKESIKIDGIDCEIHSDISPNYKKKITTDDERNIISIESIDTEKPANISEAERICFTYNSINYKISGDYDKDNNSLLNDNTMKFTEEYIKYLKSTN